MFNYKEEIVLMDLFFDVRCKLRDELTYVQTLLSEGSLEKCDELFYKQYFKYLTGRLENLNSSFEKIEEMFMPY